jgi:Xaa-Pro aminopeptidase
MRHARIPSELFRANRDRLRQLLRPNSLVLVNANDIAPTNADGSAPYYPNSDLFYLSGVEQEESVLLLAPDAHLERNREILFLRETNDHIARWEGHKLTKEEASEVSGIAHVKWLHELPSFLRMLMMEAENVYLNSNEHARATVDVETRDARFIRDIQARYPLHRYHRLARVLHDLRPVKSEPELTLIKRAAGITRDAYQRVARFVQPGVNECEIEAEFAHEFIRQRGRFAYGPIIASGANACVLHYVQNDQPCRKGDVLLLDVAAGYANYNADVTRSLPVRGRFTRRHRQVYQSVLRVLRKCSDALTPGKLPKDWQKEAEAFMEEELLRLDLLKPRDVKKQDPNWPAVKKYFMHGVGHPLGLDVHDVATIGAPFAPGWVMTVEPGIYIPEEGLGIRLEDDILITADGNVNLTREIPIEADEIEELMSKGRRSK